MRNAFLLAPIFAAISFTIRESYALMHRPDSIYVLVIFEALLFVVGYLVFGTINAMVLVPLCAVVTSFTSCRFAGFTFSLLVASSSSYVLFVAELIDRPSLIDSTIIFDVFLPFLLATYASFYFIIRAKSSNRNDLVR